MMFFLFVIFGSVTQKLFHWISPLYSSSTIGKVVFRKDVPNEIKGPLLLNYMIPMLIVCMPFCLYLFYQGNGLPEILSCFVAWIGITIIASVSNLKLSELFDKYIPGTKDENEMQIVINKIDEVH